MTAETHFPRWAKTRRPGDLRRWFIRGRELYQVAVLGPMLRLPVRSYAHFLEARRPDSPAYDSGPHTTPGDAIAHVATFITTTLPQYADVLTLVSGVATTEQRWEAAMQLARSLTPQLKDHLARRIVTELANEQDRSPTELVSTWLLPAGLILATCVDSLMQAAH
jgi:hypothetical protein